MKPSKYLLCICTILLLHGFVMNVFSSISPEITSDVGLLSNQEIADFTFDYTPVLEIIITSNEDLVSFASEGTGTKESPYIIRDYAITGQGVTYAIHITNVSKHFTIEHCRIVSIYGVVIQNLPDIQINITNNLIAQLNTFYPIEMLTGIQITNCENIVISKNNIESNFRGIDIGYSNNVNISENTVNGRTGIDHLGTSFSGITLRESINCTVTNNEFDKGGIEVESNYERLQTLILDNNTMNGLEIGYFTNINNTIVSSSRYSQVILFNCNNVTIKNQNFRKAFCGISSFFCVDCIFSNNEIKEGFCGIKISDSNNILIENNFCSGNHLGIQLEKCDNSEIRDNQCFNSSSMDGIVNSDSTNTLIQNNNCSNNQWGSGIRDDGENTTYINNLCNYNRVGIQLTDVSECKIINNTISYNNVEGGILINAGQKVIISYNLILENAGYAIALNTGTRDCIIHHNSFINNKFPSNGNSQAQDQGTKNYWYHTDTLVGNFWSDKGLKGKYSIDGTAGSYDLYPLKVPLVLPPEEYPIKTPFPYIASIFTIVILDSLRRKIVRNKTL